MDVPYAKHEITDGDVNAVVRALRSGYLTGGKELIAFEEGFKQYAGVEYALAVSSGTAALHLAVAAMEVPPGKTVLIPSLTFAATANSALYCGANIEFVDIDPDTLLIDIDIVEQKIKSNPKKYAGVIVVDFAGYPIDTKSLRAVCDKYKLWIIEDAAHALGAVSNRDNEKVKVGSSQYTDLTIFSFHPAKHLTTGEGGMVTTRDYNLYNKIKLLRSHAIRKDTAQSKREGWYYSIGRLGYNYRMSELNAALGASQLKRARKNIERRRAIAEIYTNSLYDLDIKLPRRDKINTHAYHLYVIQSKKRHALYDELKANGVSAQVHYVPLHLQTYYKNLAGSHSLPHTENYYKTCLSIPMFPNLHAEEQEYVIRLIRNFEEQSK